MEPLMSLDGYWMMENEQESRDLLQRFYEQKGIVVISNQGETSKGNQQHTTESAPQKPFAAR